MKGAFDFMMRMVFGKHQSGIVATRKEFAFEVAGSSWPGMGSGDGVKGALGRARGGKTMKSVWAMTNGGNKF
jgi:hypothetical protein